MIDFHRLGKPGLPASQTFLGLSRVRGEEHVTSPKTVSLCFTDATALPIVVSR